MKILTINSNKTKITSLAAAVALLGLGAIQAQGQSVLYNFSDGTNDGWANSGFGTTPPAVVQTIGSQHYINIPLGGYQVANVQTGAAGNLPTFTATMAAAAANPFGYNISYNYVINTAGFLGATYLQLSTYVNENNSYYAQDAANEVSLNGTQLASGGIFFGTVTINMGAVGFTGMSATDTGYKLGLIMNGNGTGVSVDYTHISVAPIPEPSSLALAGLGAVGGWLALRRRKA
jgi:hypothetical protein